jgi:hypothetical protein
MTKWHTKVWSNHVGSTFTRNATDQNLKIIPLLLRVITSGSCWRCGIQLWQSFTMKGAASLFKTWEQTYPTQYKSGPRQRSQYSYSATRYGVQGPGIEYRSGRIFPHPPDRLWCPHSRVGIEPMRGLDNPPHLSSRLKNECSVVTPLIPFWAFNGL